MDEHEIITRIKQAKPKYPKGACVWVLPLTISETDSPIVGSSVESVFIYLDGYIKYKIEGLDGLFTENELFFTAEEAFEAKYNEIFGHETKPPIVSYLVERKSLEEIRKLASNIANPKVTWDSDREFMVKRVMETIRDSAARILSIISRTY
jgi:hypothetical protein